MANSTIEYPNKLPGEQDSDDNVIWCGTIVIMSVVVVLLMIFGSFRVPSGSMENTIVPGDRVIVNKFDGNSISRGDIIVFKDSHQWMSRSGKNDLVKRVIALPGDTVSCDGYGAPVKVNGVAINEKSYIKEGVTPSRFPFKVKVYDGYFVMGDNRANSSDSRYHLDDGFGGQIAKADVIGKVIIIEHHRGLMGIKMWFTKVVNPYNS